MIEYDHREQLSYLNVEIYTMREAGLKEQVS